ncbi:AraC family transcriptional regulator [Variovorax humicola]|uniref:AraC family transcriptional regulator n=1 Tax=Variovorax humicola TaxID=1769758 RepID=A0ABU8VS68_9BURK
MALCVPADFADDAACDEAIELARTAVAECSAPVLQAITARGATAVVDWVCPDPSFPFRATPLFSRRCWRRQGTRASALASTHNKHPGRALEPLSSYRIFSSMDVDESSQFASRIWERNRTTILHGDYGLRWNHLDAGKVAFSYVQHECTVDLRAQGPLSDRFRLFLHQSGAMEHRTGKHPFVSDPHNVVVHSPGMELKSILGPSKFLLVSFDGKCVRDAMEQRFHTISRYQDWLGVLPPTADLRSLRSYTAWLVLELDNPNSPLCMAGPARGHAKRLLLTLFAECLAESAPEASEAVEDISLAQVRRAEEWITANLGEPIGVEEVASAIEVGIRSLEKSFKRVRGCTPQAFIMGRRLGIARQMLQGAGETASVTTIAMSLGFFELGRFSQRYRQLFGETPSMTLARSAGR